MSPPFLTTAIVSGDSVAIGSPAQVPCLLVPSPTATTGSVYAFTPGADPRPVLGLGLCSDLLLYLLRNGAGVVNVAVAAGTWTAAPSVTHTDANGGNSPTGPTVSLALGAGVPGCLDDHGLALVVTAGGALGVAQASLAYDGGAGVESFTLPTEGPAILRGTVDLAALSYPYAGLHSKHIDFTAPGSKTITWSASTQSSAQDIADAFNAAAVAAPLAVRARLAQGTGTQLGQVFLELYSTGVGTSTALTIDLAASDADTVLGFGSSNHDTTGTAATYAIPSSGLVATFGAGTYVAAEKYAAACVGPRCSVAALSAAASAALAAFASMPFGFYAVPLPASDAPTCKATVDALESLRAAALVANVPRDVYAVVGGPWHTASVTASTNAANVTAADQALLSAFQNAAANPNSVAPDDVYVTGSSLLAPGSFRRSSALAWALKRASAARVAATVTEGTIPDASLLAGDGLTAARDQNTATVHLEGLDGPGFFPLKSADDSGAVKFALGATRAGKTSRLRNDGDFAVCAETARLVQDVVRGWEGQKPGVDPLTGQMVQHDKGSRAGQVDDAIRSFLLPEGGLANCSDFGVTVGDPPTGKFVDNGKAPVTVTVDVLGTIQQVAITISAAGTTTIAAPAGG